MNRLRAIDRIDVGPRFTEQDAIRLNRMFRGTETEEWLRAVIEGNLVGDTAVVSSFGAESAVLLHLIAQVDSTVPVLFLDTGKHFPETLAYRDELTERLGLNRVDLYPDARRYRAALVVRSRWLLRTAQGQAAGKGARQFRCQLHRTQGVPVGDARQSAALRSGFGRCAGPAQDQPADRLVGRGHRGLFRDA